VVRVRADVAEHERGAAGDGIEAPRPAGRISLDQRRVVPLDVGHVDLAHLADLAGLHHRAGLPDHRVGAVVVGKAEHQAGLAHLAHERQRVGEGGRHRLVADHVQPGLESRQRRGGVMGVGRHDRNNVDAIGSGALGRDHRLDVRVGPCLGHVCCLCGGTTPLRVGGERSGHQVVEAVEPRGGAVDRADEAVTTPNDA
jgi:hypothetical protein